MSTFVIFQPQINPNVFMYVTLDLVLDLKSLKYPQKWLSHATCSAESGIILNSRPNSKKVTYYVCTDRHLGSHLGFRKEPIIWERGYRYFWNQHTLKPLCTMCYAFYQM